MEGAHAGFPFPIPKTGYEAMWNHLVRFNGQAYEAKYRNLNVDASGRPTLATEGMSMQEYPFWDASKTQAGHLSGASSSPTPARRAAPARRCCSSTRSTSARRTGAPGCYLPGQRRVKVAPDLAHDTPNPGTAGATTFDDTFIFNGSMDRFDFKLVGKKEMFVPYNAYAAVYQSKQDDLLKPNHLNPDLVRWELHRVWVVEATLKRRQAPRLQQAHLLPRRGLVGGAGVGRVRRARPALPRRLRLHGAELRRAGAVHRHVRPLRPGRARLLADRLHRRDRRRAPHEAAAPTASGPPTALAGTGIR